VDLNKFDGFDPSGWVTQMEHYFTLQGITDDMMKLRVGVLYLDPERWKWWEWHKKSYAGYITWSQFVKVVYAHVSERYSLFGVAYQVTPNRLSHRLYGSL
jgi:hypothetical protein